MNWRLKSIWRTYETRLLHWTPWYFTSTVAVVATVAMERKLFEAMMCSKPILISKGTAMAEVVDKGNCGLAVDCNSIEEIKQAVGKLQQNPKLCKLPGADGRVVYEWEYSWQVMGQRLLSLYFGDSQ